MTIEDTGELEDMSFRLTPEHNCSYLADRQAITLFVDPDYPIRMQQYHELAKIDSDEVANMFIARTAQCVVFVFPYALM